MMRPGLLRGGFTSASTFLLAMLIVSIAGGAVMGGSDGSATLVSYLNPLLTAFLAGIAGVWQAARGDVASKSDALLAGAGPPIALALLLLLPGIGDWSLLETAAAFVMVVVGALGGAALMARRLQYVQVD